MTLSLSSAEFYFVGTGISNSANNSNLNSNKKIHGNDFTEIFKNLAGYRPENNFVVRLK